MKIISSSTKFSFHFHSDYNKYLDSYLYIRSLDSISFNRHYDDSINRSTENVEYRIELVDVEIIFLKE